MNSGGKYDGHGTARINPEKNVLPISVMGHRINLWILS